MDQDFPEYDLYHPDMPQRLAQGGPVFFFNFVQHNYSWLAAWYKCTVKISSLRALDAHDAWMDDLDRALERMRRRGSTDLDHFKIAGYLAYWLRRRVVVERTPIMANPVPPFSLGYISPLQEDFIRFGSEISSFLVGYHYCARYEYDPNEFDLRSVHLNDEYVIDMAVLLKKKNVSPDSLYLIYRSLFYRLDQPRPKAAQDSGG